MHRIAVFILVLNSRNLQRGSAESFSSLKLGPFYTLTVRKLKRTDTPTSHFLNVLLRTSCMSRNEFLMLRQACIVSSSLLYATLATFDDSKVSELLLMSISTLKYLSTQHGLTVSSRNPVYLTLHESHCFPTKQPLKRVNIQ